MNHLELQNVHPYLKEKSTYDIDGLCRHLTTFDLLNESFLHQLRDWLNNFDGDRLGLDLAFKILMKLQYFSEKRLESEFSSILNTLRRQGIRLNGAQKNAYLVTPKNIADSANKHAWLISKLSGISGQEFIALDDVKNFCHTNDLFVFVNDTHGSGNQFCNQDVWPNLKMLGISPSRIIISGIVIANPAKFAYDSLGFRVYGQGARDAKDELNNNEYLLAEKYGKLITPKTPLGFGNVGLLTAYHFQCPNNSLPILWASNENTSTYPWKPLFPYRGKPKTSDINHQTMMSTNETMLTDAVAELKALLLSQKKADAYVTYVGETATHAFTNLNSSSEEVRRVAWIILSQWIGEGLITSLPKVHIYCLSVRNVLKNEMQVKGYRYYTDLFNDNNDYIV